MNAALKNIQTSLCGIVVLAVASAMVVQGRINWETFVAAIATAGGLLAAKDGHP